MINYLQITAGIQLDPSYDIYSYGILMAEISMRGLTYIDEEAVSRLGGLENAMMNGERPLLQQIGGSSLPDGYDALARLGWNSDVTKRPKAQQIVMELEQILKKLERNKQKTINGDNKVISPFSDDDSIKINNAFCNNTIDVGKPSPSPSSSPSLKTSFIIILNSSSFKKPSLFSARRFSKAQRYEALIPGMKAYNIDDPSLHQFLFKGTASGEHYTVKVVYKRHPGNFRKYIPLIDYAEKMLREKEEEFLGIMRKINISGTTRKFGASGGSIGIIASAMANLSLKGRMEHVDDNKRCRVDVYENPASSIPFFDSKKSYLFYQTKVEWIGIHNARLFSPNPMVSLLYL